jgi:hypothetical protein
MRSTTECAPPAPECQGIHSAKGTLASSSSGHPAKSLANPRSWYLWGGFSNCGNYPPLLKKHSLYFSQTIIWHKLHPVLTRKDYMGAHEWAFYGWKQGSGHGSCECHRSIVGQENQPTKHDPFD